MSLIKVKPEDVIESLVKIIGGVDAEIIFVTCIDDNGDISDSECFASATQPKNSVPLDELFYLAERMGAPAVLFTSTSSGSITELHECDVDFTRRLIEGGRERGIVVHDHILVEGDTFRIMSQCTDLWKG